jgi:hypothetical protein
MSREREAHAYEGAREEEILKLQTLLSTCD